MKFQTDALPGYETKHRLGDDSYLGLGGRRSGACAHYSSGNCPRLMGARVSLLLKGYWPERPIFPTVGLRPCSACQEMSVFTPPGTGPFPSPANRNGPFLF
jgi:hypothetical protein